MELNKVDAIITRYKDERGPLISILQDIQAEFNYLPKESLLRVKEKLNIPLTEMLRIATFYKSFSLEPRGRHLIEVCQGTACHVRGGARILERIEKFLGIKPGQTTKDLKFTLKTVNCLGACALGPLVVIDEEYFGKITPAKAEKLLKEYKE